MVQILKGAEYENGPSSGAGRVTVLKKEIR
jgi:hypothetical protein